MGFKLGKGYKNYMTNGSLRTKLRFGQEAGSDASVDQAMDYIANPSGNPTNFKLRKQDIERDERGQALLNLLDTNKNVSTLFGGGAQQNPMGYNPFQMYKY